MLLSGSASAGDLLQVPLCMQVTFYNYDDLSDVAELSSGNFGATYKARLQDEPVVCKVAKKGAGADDWAELQVSYT